MEDNFDKTENSVKYSSLNGTNTERKTSEEELTMENDNMVNRIEEEGGYSVSQSPSPSPSPSPSSPHSTQSERVWEYTGKTKTGENGRTLRQIRATRDLIFTSYSVSKGDVGGWIEKDENLTGQAWVGKDSEVFGNAVVTDNACVLFGSIVKDNAIVSGDSVVCNYSGVKGHAKVAVSSIIRGHSTVQDNAVIEGYCIVDDGVDISGDAVVNATKDFSAYHNNWTSHRTFVYTRSNKMWKVGCFYGTGKELVNKAYADSKVSGKCYEAIVKAQEKIDRARDKDERIFETKKTLMNKLHELNHLIELHEHNHLIELDGQGNRVHKNFLKFKFKRMLLRIWLRIWLFIFFN